MLASLALVAVLWSGDGAAATAPVSVPIEPIKPIEPLDNGLDQPIVAHPYLYTLLETALGIGAGTVWYLRHGSDERWGRAMQWTSWRRKLFTTDEITFDGDHFNTNSVGHPFDGTAYYQIARGNGLSPAGAFVSTVLASTFWEYFIEISREPVAERPHHDAGGGRRHRRGDVPVGALPRAERVGRGALRRRAAVRTGGDAERGPALSSPAQALAEGAAGSGGGLRPRHVQRQHDAERARVPPRGGRRLAE